MKLSIDTKEQKKVSTMWHISHEILPTPILLEFTKLTRNVHGVSHLRG